MVTTVCVCGGAGYIGSHIVLALLARGDYRVIVVDNLSTGHRGAVPASVTFYEADIRDIERMTEILKSENVDAVMHFCADSLVGVSMKQPLQYYDNNVGGARRLLQAMDAAGVGKIVFSSTAAVYGEPERQPIKETDATVPTNPYGETKLAIEKMLKWVSKASGLRYVCLRYFNACGADPELRTGEDHSPETHLLPIVLQVAAGRRERVAIFGSDYPTRDGTCVRDYIDVRDLADAHIRALCYMDNDDREHVVFNLGTSAGVTVREALDTCREITGHPIPADDADRRPGDPATLIADATRAREVLGWVPQFSIRDSVDAAWNWHSNKPDGFGDRK